MGTIASGANDAAIESACDSPGPARCRHIPLDVFRQRRHTSHAPLSRPELNQLQPELPSRRRHERYKEQAKILRMNVQYQIRMPMLIRSGIERIHLRHKLDRFRLAIANNTAIHRILRFTFA